MAAFLFNPFPSITSNRRSSVFQPRYLVWKCTALTVPVSRKNGEPPVNKSVKQAAPTLNSKSWPDPPVADGLVIVSTQSELLPLMASYFNNSQRTVQSKA